MIVLDTHVLVWWVGLPKKLSHNAKRSIEMATKRKEILVSSMSIWEICMLVKKERLKFKMDLESWISRLESVSSIRFVPVDNTISMKSVSLPAPLHNDPADRMIVATALLSGAVLITADKQIQNYPHVQTLW